MDLTRILLALAILYVLAGVLMMLLGLLVRHFDGRPTWAQIWRGSIIWPRVIYEAYRYRGGQR